MKSILSFFFIVTGLFINAQYCEINNRFSDQAYFNSSEIESILDTTYALSFNNHGVMQSLEMDIYYPSFDHDTLDQRPVIVLFHGGGFYLGDKTNFSYECEEFAKRGFVSVTVEYRLGEASDAGMEALKRSYRARQDGHAALRFLVENSELLKIDVDNIFIGGMSAGSLLSQDLIYGEQSEWDLLFPSISAELGDTDTAGNNYTHDFDLKALYNNCGSATSLNVDNSEMIPTVAFHKEYDHIVPIDANLNTYSYGSRKMHELLELANICSQLTVDTNWYDPISGGHCPFTDWQGTLTRVNKASCFFKNLMCDNCEGGYSEVLFESNCSSITSEETIESNSLNIYPNPAEDMLFIEGLKENTLICIYNSKGQLIQSQTSSNRIEIENLESGLYIIQFENESTLKNIRFIKR